MDKPSLNLRPSEAVLAQSATHLYAAYWSAGRVPEGQEQSWMTRAVADALAIARLADEAVVSDDEMG